MEATAVSEPPQVTPQEQKQESIIVPQNKSLFKGFMQRVFSILGLNHPDTPRSAEEILKDNENNILERSGLVPKRNSS